MVSNRLRSLKNCFFDLSLPLDEILKHCDAYEIEKMKNFYPPLIFRRFGFCPFKWVKALARPTISRTISWILRDFDGSNKPLLGGVLKDMRFSFKFSPKRLTFWIEMDAMRFFILCKRSEFRVFPRRYVQSISCGIIIVLVMRFVISQSSGASRRCFARMQMARSIKVKSDLRLVSGLRR